MADYIKLSPESFRTLYLRKEDRIILKTEQNRRIVLKRLTPDEWTPYRIYDYEKALNENKRNILLVDEKYASQIEREIEEKIR